MGGSSAHLLLVQVLLLQGFQCLLGQKLLQMIGADVRGKFRLLKDPDGTDTEQVNVLLKSVSKI